MNKFLELFTSAHTVSLKERDSRVIELRYGLSGDKPQTLAAIGEELGVYDYTRAHDQFGSD